METKKIKVALPAGSLKENTIKLFRKAAFRIDVEDRSYFPLIDDPEIECMFIRAQEIPRYVELGKFDFGITGKDWIEESGKNVMELGGLVYSKRGFNSVRLVIAVQNDSAITSLRVLTGKTIATEFVNITNKYLENNKINAAVEFSWGATEAKVPFLCDAVVELVDSGKSLKANGLRIITTVMESTVRMITNQSSYGNAWKRQKMDTLVLLIKSALDSEGMVGLKMNIPEEPTQKILEC